MTFRFGIFLCTSCVLFFLACGDTATGGTSSSSTLSGKSSSSFSFRLLRLGSDRLGLFGRDTVPIFELEVNDSLWEWLNENAELEEYVPARFVTEEGELAVVGIRYKGGNGTLVSCVGDGDKWSCPKLSMKLRFDKYETDTRFHGMKRLNLHSMVREPSLLREKLSYGLFRSFEVVAPLSHWAWVKLNGEDLGLFSMVEQIDGRFTDANFPNGGNGNLYKEIWPMFDFESAYLENKKTGDDPDASAFVDFASEIASWTPENFAARSPRWIDSDYHMRLFLADQAMVNWDGPASWYCFDGECSPHNFLWYHDPAEDLFWMIPWDLDQTFTLENPFEALPPFLENPGNCAERYSVLESATPARAAGCDPLISSLAFSDRQHLLGLLDEFLQGPFLLSAMQDSLNRWRNIIGSLVQKDTKGPGFSVWNREADRLSALLPILNEKLQAAAEGKKYESWGISADSLTDFRTADPGVFAAFATVESNGKSDFAVTVGTGGLEMDLVFRNESDDAEEGTWSQFARLSIPAEKDGSLDLLSKTGLEIRISCSPSRSMLVKLASEVPEQLAADKFYQWEISPAPALNTFRLDFADAALPTRGTDLPDQKSLVFAALAGIFIEPLPDGMVDGLFFPGTNDSMQVVLESLRFY